jgi:hypothetical protein
MGKRVILAFRTLFRISESGGDVDVVAIWVKDDSGVVQ